MMGLNRDKIDKCILATHVGLQTAVGKGAIFRVTKLAMLFIALAFTPLNSNPTFGSQPTSSHNFDVSVLWTAAPLKMQFLTSMNIPTRQFELVEYIDCGNQKTIDCSTYYAKLFTFDHGEVRLITTSEVDEESYGAEFERTENKYIEIFSALTSQTAFEDNFEIEGLGEFEVEYWFDAEVPTQLHCQLDFKDLRGNSLWQENCGSGIIQSIKATFDEVDHYWLIFIDGRSCGASSCNGSLEILKFSNL